jgi:uncharacterized protein (DUF1015 family)
MKGQNMAKISYLATHDVELVELDQLKPHEEVDPTYLELLEKEIEFDGMLKFAIAIDKNRNIILDGHHRVAALKKLGCTRIPAVFVDYNSSYIEVQSRKNDVLLTKEDVVRAGIGPKKLPPKTSRHMVRASDTTQHISVIEKKVDISLKELKEA